ncbi:endonuclease III [Psychrobacter sp. TAE2020]|uniref:endonuclease III n=1 Tax=Psychrobacter sp. TAE2020 TaxID=2846762 RepID=UPI001C127B6A|nr:endonuclease III [Psychrobacter sp. TAE2020]MBU5616215.1 endonuclease III [Psychrobacter sp. TAE2020]
MSKIVKHKTANTPPSRLMPKRNVRPFFEKLAETIKEPVTELHYKSNFELLIAVILSAQATDISVNIATQQLYPVANTPAAIWALGVDGLKPYIKNIGLYNAKAKNVIKTCRDLIDNFDGQVPDNRKDLESLAGVGRKTANVVLNTAFGQPTMAVDTHIFRVGNRTGLATGKNVLIVEQKLVARIPDDFMLDAHHYLILHGRYICQARTPKCGECPVYAECMFKDKAAFAEI